MTFEEYKETLLPGNYALTKSMEISKTTTSGTLWYTKKFLVLYYYVFLSEDIETDTYIEKVTTVFNEYIESMPQEQRREAKKFFFPEDNTAINFESAQFVKFSVFASFNSFANAEEKFKYFLNAKKCYFMLLMDVGGQTGVKKIFKDKLSESGFIYSNAGIRDILYNAAITVSVEQMNVEGKIRDNSVKNIITATAMEEIEELDSEICNFDLIKDIVDTHGGVNEKYRSIENDAVAFIRNERQILFYYGYFHSKSAGANEMEFSSLTPVGEVALTANYLEFLAIWEHQKVKMISQPALAEINDLPQNVDVSKFALSFSPYVDILSFMDKFGRITLDEYKFYVSRKKHTCVEKYDDVEDTIVANLDQVKTCVETFGRKRDIKDEDGNKELIKYLQGCRDDISMDKKSNILGFCKKITGGYQVVDESILNNMLCIYKRLTDYKIKKAKPVFLEAEQELVRRYKETQQNNTSQVDPKVKIHWDFYNIGIEKFILLGVFTAISCANLGVKFEQLSDMEKRIEVREYIISKFTLLLKEVGARTDKQKRGMVDEAIQALIKEDYTVYLEEIIDEEEIITRYTEEAASDLMIKIKNMSIHADVTKSVSRKRNSTLIGVLKAYYMKLYMKDGTLECESCGNQSFLTQKGEPYVEFHHVIPFKEAYGPDHYLNLYALCPLCHRKIHYMSTGQKKDIYTGLDEHNYFEKTLVERLKELRENKCLKSYHLEFLLVDEAITQEEYDLIAA